MTPSRHVRQIGSPVKRILFAVVVALAVLVPTAAVAAHRTAYPHAGEDVRFRDTDPYLGRPTNRPSVFMVGDSITQRSMSALRHQGIRWEISAVPGRDVANLPYYVADRARAKPFLKTLVIALGTNATPEWSYADYRRVTNMVSRSTHIVFVTTYRDPARNPDTFAYRNRASVQVTYTRWMRLIAQVRPHTCVADWRSYVIAHPSAAPDGVHPYYGARRAWSHLIMSAVRNCR